MSDGVPQRRVHDIEMVKLARRIIGMQIPPQPSQEMPATQTAEWWHYPPVTGGQYRPGPKTFRQEGRLLYGYKQYDRPTCKDVFTHDLWRVSDATDH